MDVNKFSERAREAIETAQGVVRRGPGNVLGMEEQMNAMAAEVQRLKARLEEAAAAMHREIERVERSHRFELVPVSHTQIVPLGRRRRRA